MAELGGWTRIPNTNIHKDYIMPYNEDIYIKIFILNGIEPNTTRVSIYPYAITRPDIGSCYRTIILEGDKIVSDTYGIEIPVPILAENQLLSYNIDFLQELLDVTWKDQYFDLRSDDCTVWYTMFERNGLHIEYNYYEGKGHYNLSTAIDVQISRSSHDPIISEFITLYDKHVLKCREQW